MTLGLDSILAPFLVGEHVGERHHADAVDALRWNFTALDAAVDPFSKIVGEPCSIANSVESYSVSLGWRSGGVCHRQVNPDYFQSSTDCASAQVNLCAIRLICAVRGSTVAFVQHFRSLIPN
jgi:hypothetical protein